MDQPSPGILKKIEALLNIHAGEGKMVFLLFALGLLQYFANVFARTTTYALFLAEFDAETLPFVYIGIAILATLVSYVYLRLTGRFSMAIVLATNGGFNVLLLLSLWLGMEFTEASWIRFSLPIAFGIHNTLIITGYWGLIGRVFNIQQGKRLSGLVATAETLAFLFGGLMMPFLVNWVGSINILLISTLFMGLSFLLQLYVNQFLAGPLTTPPQRETPQQARTQEGSTPMKSTYVRLIFGLFTLFIIGIYFVDNTFYALAEIQFPDADRLTSFVGLFWGVSSIMVLLMQSLVSGRIMIRFGVGVVMMLTPGIILIESGLMSLVGANWGLIPLLFWLGVVANISRIVLDATDQAAVNILYQPLPVTVRTRAQTIVNGILYPVSIGLAGVLLLLFRQILDFGVVESIYIIFVIAACWLAVAVMLRRAYPQALLQALTRRDFGDTSYLVGDAASLAVFRQGLNSPHPGVVVYALQMLQQVAPELMSEQLPRLLDHAEAAVKLDVLRRIEELGLASALPVIKARIPLEDSPAVRGACIRVMATLGDDEDLFDEILLYLDEPAPELRAGALVGLLRSGHIEGIIAAAGHLIEGVNSDEVSDRLFVAQVLGEGGISSFYRPVLKLLGDEDPGVRRLALVAAGKLKNPRLWPSVIGCLSSLAVRGAAVTALASGGESALPLMRTALADRDRTRAAVFGLVRALGRIRGKQAAAVLWEHVDYPDEQIRSEVLLALDKCLYRAAGSDRQFVEQQIKAEVAQAVWISAVLQDLDRNESTWLLRSSLEQHLQRHRRRLFLWCSLIYERQVVKKIEAALSRRRSANGESADDQQKSYALEAIDLMLPPALKSVAQPLLQGAAADALLSALSSSFPQQRRSMEQRLEEILAAPAGWLTPWLRAAALYTGAELNVTPLSPALATALDSPEPLVRETAIWCLAKLDAEMARERLPGLRADPDPQVARLAKQLSVAMEGEFNMLSTVEKVIALKAVTLFANTPDEVLAEVTAALSEVRVAADENIFEKGDVGNALYIITDGLVRIHDREQTIDMHGGGNVIGEMSILDAAPRSASATAVEDSLLLRLDQDSFRELLNDHGDVAWRVMQLLSQRLRHAMSQDAKSQAE